MQHLFPPSFAGQSKPPALMLRRLQRRHEALMGPPTDRLFLAVVPDEQTAARIGEKARHLRISHGLTGKGVRPEHLHVTLCHVGDGIGLPVSIVDRVKERVASVAMPSFRVCFDRAESFKNGALVLRGDDGTIGLEILQQRLNDALDEAPRKARAFTPHVTLLRDSHRVPEQRIEPIEWTVREIVLVHSLLGRTTHRHIARWSLTG
jgi:2'-5' RNA ligase